MAWIVICPKQSDAGGAGPGSIRQSKWKGIFALELQSQLTNHRQATALPHHGRFVRMSNHPLQRARLKAAASPAGASRP